MTPHFKNRDMLQKYADHAAAMPWKFRAMSVVCSTNVAISLRRDEPCAMHVVLRMSVIMLMEHYFRSASN